MLKELFRKAKSIAIPTVMILFLVWGATSTYKACSIGEENAVLKAEAESIERISYALQREYDEFKEWTLAALETRDKSILALTESIVHHERTIATQITEIVRLKMIEPVAPELESHPLTINLRSQIAAQDKAIVEQAAEISDLHQVVADLNSKVVLINQAWLKSEDNTKVSNDATVKWKTYALNLEKDLKISRAWSNVKGITAVVAGVLLVVLVVT